MVASTQSLGRENLLVRLGRDGHNVIFEVQNTANYRPLQQLIEIDCLGTAA